MVVFPNCKINLGLNIIGKRADGYHNLETVFLPVPLHDALEVVQTSSGLGGGVELSCTGLPVGGQPADNLCLKAYNILRHYHPQLPLVKMHLLKAIPMGAGLGGGSADGAFTLILLNKKFGLGVTDKQLKEYALQLGSDCPFFIINKPSFATQRGEQLEEINLPLGGYSLLLVNAGIHISTAWAFAQIKPANPAKNIWQIIQQPIETWKTELVNDFEQPVVANHPVLQQIKANLYNLGAVYAGMTGSGSTFFGIFKKVPPSYDSVFPPEYLVKLVNL